MVICNHCAAIGTNTDECGCGLACPIRVWDKIGCWAWWAERTGDPSTSYLLRAIV